MSAGYETPTVQGRPYPGADPKSALAWALLVCAALAAPTALLWGRPAVEHAAAVLAAATAATPVLITMFIYGYGYEYSTGWRYIAIGFAAFVLGSVVAAIGAARRPAVTAAGR